MANTYTLISSNVLTSSAATVTFSAIPSTYTDLVLRWSARGTAAVSAVAIYAKLNTSTGVYSYTLVGVDDGTVLSDRGSNQTNNDSGRFSGGSTTANTFGSGELYLPNYAGTTQKPMSSFAVSENNSSTVYRIRANAMLANVTSAVSSIELSTSTGNFDSGSSFYLYGIKNS